MSREVWQRRSVSSAMAGIRPRSQGYVKVIGTHHAAPEVAVSLRQLWQVNIYEVFSWRVQIIDFRRHGRNHDGWLRAGGV